ncbi:hypothetical protein AGR2A_pc0032 [Agrobacterium genomosp. 2 str. CFBP 5494]|uniref:Chromosome partitioning domain protein n=2 Tax=Hyphomicrobiales TaxID=356 RepID=A0A256GZP5_9HYPH|nr:chromosome partitioning domain protein [Brucella lupini]CUX03822.1 hypothetical protein AGR2A_pc0032 [Agrobacterium genomosp. 2 str. CFBP 5494]
MEGLGANGSQVGLALPLSLNRALLIPATCPSQGSGPACASRQGCSAAIAPRRPTRGPGDVFEKEEDRKERQRVAPPGKGMLQWKSSKSIRVG